MTFVNVALRPLFVSFLALFSFLVMSFVAFLVMMTSILLSSLVEETLQDRPNDHWSSRERIEETR